ncbi:hypothetical protein L3Y34_009542 [Caenorhabditis briggsae]|uniref:Uncharacterized protein n=1 Tax=Caenorhabditis briggsae TaxID=6238 RepID=A0AAE9A5L9_CAEBR|nr:hypothetical protein L3Y34_009542 [Caenorhabditis briggsae]
METSTTTYDDANRIFPNSEMSTKLILFIAHPTIQIQFYIAIIGLIITFFHLIILKRKSIMTTSVISIMIGIGLCDFVAMIATIIYSWIIYNEDDDNPWYIATSNQFVAAVSTAQLVKIWEQK